MPVIKILVRPFYKTSGFKCTPKFDFVKSYLRCSEDDYAVCFVCIFVPSLLFEDLGPCGHFGPLVKFPEKITLHDGLAFSTWL